LKKKKKTLFKITKKNVNTMHKIQIKTGKSGDARANVLNLDLWTLLACQHYTLVKLMKLVFGHELLWISSYLDSHQEFRIFICKFMCISFLFSALSFKQYNYLYLQTFNSHFQN
jgi:hypothetical protein